jgi:nucleotide-binding universal stress UspA family protein
MFSNILVPLDGSELAECVMTHVEALAGGHKNVAITFLYVVQPLDAPMVQASYRKKIESEGKAAAQAYVKKLCSRVAFKDNASGKVLIGKAADTIVNFAEKSKVDLIVMATHGRSGVSEFFYGSVAEKVIHAAKVPIWMVKAASCQMSYANRKLTVLAPLDGSKIAENVLTHLKDLHKQLPHNKLEIILMRVCEIFAPPITYPPPMAMGWDEYLIYETGRCKEICKTYLAGIQAKFSKSQMKTRAEILEGVPAEKVISYANKHSVDLIVMSTHGRTGISKWAFGSIAEKVLRGADCPVLLVHAK